MQRETVPDRALLAYLKRSPKRNGSYVVVVAMSTIRHLQNNSDIVHLPCKGAGDSLANQTKGGMMRYRKAMLGAALIPYLECIY